MLKHRSRHYRKRSSRAEREPSQHAWQSNSPSHSRKPSLDVRLDQIEPEDLPDDPNALITELNLIDHQIDSLRKKQRGCIRKLQERLEDQNAQKAAILADARNLTGHTPMKDRRPAVGGAGPPDDVDDGSLVHQLKKLQQQANEKSEIKLWTRRLTNLFYSADTDGSGEISFPEYKSMLNKLPLTPALRASLEKEFDQYDDDKSGHLDFDEFLRCFWHNSHFKDEIVANHSNNAPYIGSMEDLPRCKRLRLWLYKVVEEPGFNCVSKLIFLLDCLLILIPLVTLAIQGIKPDTVIDWTFIEFEWGITIYFASQYVLGLLTCKRKCQFVKNKWHVLDLFSIVPWIIYSTVAHFQADRMDPLAFVIFRSIRIVKIHRVFKMEGFRLNLQIYAETLHLAYFSYQTLSSCLFFLVIIFALLTYATERGHWNDNTKKWSRSDDELESPFSNFYNCIYFTLVTMTTLGYGDMFPKSPWGKLVAIVCVAVGLINLTFLINIIGECFEEVFREYIEGKSKKMEVDYPRYVEKHVKKATATLIELQSGHKRRWFRKGSKVNQLKHEHRTNDANTKRDNPLGGLLSETGPSQAVQATETNGLRQGSMEIRRADPDTRNQRRDIPNDEISESKPESRDSAINSGPHLAPPHPAPDISSDVGVSDSPIVAVQF